MQMSLRGLCVTSGFINFNPLKLWRQILSAHPINASISLARHSSVPATATANVAILKYNNSKIRGSNELGSAAAKIANPYELLVLTEAYSPKAKAEHRFSQLWQNPSVREILQDEGLAEGHPITPQILEKIVASVESHLACANSESLWTILFDICANAGPPFFELGFRLWGRVGRDDAFVSRLGFLRLLANNVAYRPKLHKTLSVELERFVADHASVTNSPIVARELLFLFSRSRDWKKGFEFLGRLKSKREAEWKDFCCLATVAAKQGELDAALLLLRNYDESFGWSRSPILMQNRLENISEIWKEALDEALRLQRVDASAAAEQMVKILQFWKRVSYAPHRDEVDKVSAWFKGAVGAKRVFDGVVVPSSGVCPISGTSLARPTARFFETIQRTFSDHLLAADNVYRHSDPRDLANLQNFVRMFGPFDAVVDGLNIFYTAPRDRRPNSQCRIKDVAGIVRSLRHDLGLHRVAVIARRWWNLPRYAKVMDNLRRHAKTYLAKNLTEDDLFAFHCCFQSGRDSFLVSNDLFFDLRMTLPAEHRESLVEFQLARQINCTYDADVDELRLVPPRPYAPFVQRRGEILYVPSREWTEEEVRGLTDVHDINDRCTSIGAALRIPNSFVAVRLDEEDEILKIE